MQYYKGETDTIYFMYFELDNKGKVFERTVYNLKDVLISIGGIANALKIAIVLAILPFIKD